MKILKYIIIVTCIFSVFALNSCEDFLTDTASPQDQPGGDGFYDSPLKVKAGIIGIYEELTSLYELDPNENNIFSIYENRSDNASRTSSAESDRNNFDTKVGNSPEKMWTENFKLISRANLMIQAIEDGFPDFPNDPELARYMGEARFLRAFSYFHLIEIFGRVPMITEQIRSAEEARQATMSNSDIIFDEVIIPDLEYASSNCFTRSQIEGLGEIGHAPQGAAKVLLAEAYLNRGQFAQAESVAEEVIASGEYRLVSDFEALYGNGADNNSESIFEIQYNYEETGKATQWSRLLPFGVEDAVNFNLPMSVSVPSDNMVQAMVSTNDTRYAVTLDTGLVRQSDDTYFPGRLWLKYIDFSLAGVSTLTDDWNIKLFRLADAYHFAAEAEIQQNKISDAFAHLNVLRQRVGMPDFDANGVSQSDALDMYLHERRMEFAGEMKRWRDLKRTGKAEEVIEAYLEVDIDPNQLVYPIPLSEINANPAGITQNPGY